MKSMMWHFQMTVKKVGINNNFILQHCILGHFSIAVRNPSAVRIQVVVKYHFRVFSFSDNDHNGDFHRCFRSFVDGSPNYFWVDNFHGAYVNDSKRFILCSSTLPTCEVISASRHEELYRPAYVTDNKLPSVITTSGSLVWFSGGWTMDTLGNLNISRQLVTLDMSSRKFAIVIFEDIIL